MTSSAESKYNFLVMEIIMVMKLSHRPYQIFTQEAVRLRLSPPHVLGKLLACITYPVFGRQNMDQGESTFFLKSLNQ